LKILSCFLGEAKILDFAWEVIFRHLGTKWCIFVFQRLDFCPGHMTIPEYVVVNLNTIYSTQIILLSLNISPDALQEVCCQS